MLLFEGLKVLDVGTWVAGPVAATILADFGADVIKVEMPGRGDPFRYLPRTQNTPGVDVNYTWIMDGRNKRSITLDLKSAEGQEVLRKLIAECDVYLTNQPMGVRRRMKLTYEDIAPLNDRMVYASLTAYGERGPEAEKTGFDGIAYWVRSGLSDMVRSPGGGPSQSIAGMGDHPTCVAMFACIMMGLYKRQITGKGERYLRRCWPMGSGPPVAWDRRRSPARISRHGATPPAWSEPGFATSIRQVMNG